jgi:hypothetical protein
MNVMKTNYIQVVKTCKGCQFLIQTRKTVYGRVACGHGIVVLGLPVDWAKIGQDREVFPDGVCDDWRRKTLPDIPESPF